MNLNGFYNEARRSVIPVADCGVPPVCLSSRLNMRKRLSVILVIAAAALSLAFQAPAGWSRLDSAEGGFTVLMPGPVAPKDKVTTRADAGVGTYTAHVFTQTAEKGIFIVGWLDYAPEVSVDVRGELTSNRDTFVRRMKARLLSERPITLEGHPGLEYTAETDQAVFKVHTYVVGRRPYHVVAVTFKGFDDSQKVNAFLSSFRLKPQEQ